MQTSNMSKLADGATAVSLTAAAGIHLAQIALVVQIIGGLIACASGVVAIYYHVKAARRMK